MKEPLEWDSYSNENILRAALLLIEGMTKRRQLPITAEINDIAKKALERAKLK